MQFISLSTFGTNRQRLFGNSVYLLLPLSHAIAGCGTVSYFFNVSKRVLFEGALLSVTPFNVLVGLGASKIIVKSINNDTIETRMTQYNEIKTKTTQISLPDPNGLT